jgi:hypothetical protein
MASTAVRTTTTEVVVTQTVRHLDASDDALIKEYAKHKEDIKVLEAKKKAGVKRVELKDRTLTKVDRKALQAAFPEAYEATLRTTEYTVLDAE